MLDKQASRIMPRTTLNLDPSVLRALKRRARDEGTSIGNLISEMLGPTLAEGRTPRSVPFHWRTARMGPARVDLEDKEAVHEALDGR